jgi:hypothetical protein
MSSTFVAAAEAREASRLNCSTEDLERRSGQPSSPLTVTHREVFLSRTGQHIELLVSRPLCSTRPPAAVLYVLDPYPEIFAITCTHLLGRCGYESDKNPNVSALRRLAVVGVGHDPAEFKADPHGWDVGALKALRRRDFLFDRDNAFLSSLAEAVARAEAFLGLGAAALAVHRRALLGCSLSSLLTLRTLFDLPGTFGALIAGSPSLPLAPRLLAVARRSPPVAPDSARDILLVTSEGDSDIDGRASIASKAAEMAEALRQNGHRATDVLLAGETHGSMKPALVSRCFTWLEAEILGRAEPEAGP